MCIFFNCYFILSININSVYYKKNLNILIFLINFSIYLLLKLKFFFLILSKFNFIFILKFLKINFYLYNFFFIINLKYFK